MKTMGLLYAKIFLISLVLGCTAIKPVNYQDEKFMSLNIFSHNDIDRALQRFVDDKGLVDYTALKKNPSDIERYYFFISTFSPDSHPTLFPTKADQLAYWINAYNASAIKIVLTYYPISSVLDVKPPFPFFFLPDKAGFFVFQRVTVGGKTTHLYYLENQVIRKRFGDPRIHFALNCAARGCPRLPRQAFTAEHLDGQLDHETRKFLAEERNLRIDHREKVVYLSMIFKWYKKDFLKGYQNRFPTKEATLLNYVALYLSAEKADELTRSASPYEIRFIPYDWHINDRSG
jgi:hypothetical protein